ncbi:hypothetical protein CHS0354_038658 [Potamilus streckersoni]|uniref:Uncharacterized protein n=1 Tax=Potamilus streckersoni TaxID=2493646 RepID=A0AAE0T873_9BIVA|nr:hypothetical protein CHS0354_038658 [Potamilus streckersoni]
MAMCITVAYARSASRQVRVMGWTRGPCGALLSFDLRPLTFLQETALNISEQSLEEHFTRSSSVFNQCPFSIAPDFSQAAPSRYRNIDGSCNNLNNGLWGAAFTPFERILPAIYDYCKEFCPCIEK